MKKTYNVAVRTAAGAILQHGVLAEDSTATPPAPAIVVAISAALTATGAGAEVLSVNYGSTVDIDATIVAS